MIVVFVVDTSPSMGEPLHPPTSSSSSSTSSSASNAASSNKSLLGMSRLDLAKMTVESLVKMLEKRVHDHNFKVQADTAKFGYTQSDQFLLLSTGCQHTDNNDNAQSTIACGAGGRLLVGFDARVESRNDGNSFGGGGGGGSGGGENQFTFVQSHGHGQGQSQKHEFDMELKRLRATKRSKTKDAPFPEDGGGASGLNAALSAGLQLLSRHRLQNRCTENFGMGRLPSNAILAPTSNGGGLQQASNALQPACLVLITDGDCLRKPPSEGGGSLQLQFGKIPLREYYREPFRWDQRIFCLGVGPSGDKLHPSLRAFADVTGGCHTPIRSVADISQITYLMSRLISPPLPSPWPIQNPLRLPNLPPPLHNNRSENDAGSSNVNGEVFVNGGPVCSFQTLERSPRTGQPGAIHRAMLLYIPCWNNDAVKTATTITHHQQPNQNPIWAIPESFFPTKKLDSLPPRAAQPMLHYTRYYQAVGSPVFDPMNVMKMLHRLDQFVISNRTMSHGSAQAAKLLQRDVYICQWLSQDGRPTKGPSSQRGMEHFPICVRGAGRNSLSDGEENVLNIGILHMPDGSGASSGGSKAPSSLTLVPPDPHILLPLLIRAAEIEHRQLKKASASTGAQGEATNLLNVSKNLLLDENWRTEMRAYLFRVPPYYQPGLKRCLRSILPPSVHSLLSSDAAESAVSQCLSRQVLQKIRTGEQIAKDNNERLERREGEYRRHSAETNQYSDVNNTIRYGQYDSRSPMSSYLNALRKMPPPSKRDEANGSCDNATRSNLTNGTNKDKPLSVVDCIGDLPPEGLLAFYESRRRWIFGGDGLTTKGLSVDGVHRGTNSHRHNAKHTIMDEPLLSLAGVGASSLNKTPISKMGDFKERLLFTNQPVIGYGCNDSTVSPISTGPDGSPAWSVSDEFLPMSLFDPITGEFNDSAQARVRARLMINFGNPFKDKRADTIVPGKFSSQRPPTKRDISPTNTPQGSPPHDAFSSSVEGEGEAEFAGLSPPRVDETEVKRKHPDSPAVLPTEKRAKINKADQKEHVKNSPSIDAKSKPPPPSAPLSPSPNPPFKSNIIRSEESKGSPPVQRPPAPRPLPPARRPPPPKPRQHPPNNKQLRPPAPKPAQPMQNKQHNHNRPPPPAPTSQNPNAKPNIKLPDGWICVWSKSQKKWYYFDKKTNKSVWEWPPPGGIH